MDITNSLVVCDIKRTYEREFTAKEMQLKLEMMKKNVWSAALGQEQRESNIE